MTELNAYTYQVLEDNSYLLRQALDSCELTTGLKKIIDKVRATKCVMVCDFYTAERDMQVILNPDLYFALKGQMVNPIHQLSKEERSNFARILNQRNCVIRMD